MGAILKFPVKQKHEWFTALIKTCTEGVEPILAEDLVKGLTETFLRLNEYNINIRVNVPPGEPFTPTQIESFTADIQAAVSDGFIPLLQNMMLEILTLKAKEILARHGLGGN